VCHFLVKDLQPTLTPKDEPENESSDSGKDLFRGGELAARAPLDGNDA
jgi:hypothetical protein